MKAECSFVKRIERKVPLATRVYLDLKNAIVNSEFDPGQFLHEEYLAQITGASRTPIREALLHLQRDGLVEMIPRKGAKIWELEPQRIVELIDLQLLYESPFFDLPELPSVILERIEEIGTQMLALAAAIERETPQSEQWYALRCAYSELGFDFHRSLVKFQHNSCLLDAYDLMMSKVKMYFNCRLAKSSNYFQTSSRQHQNIIAAILEGKLDTARDLHLAHLSQVRS